jgi:hypothetical protein
VPSNREADQLWRLYHCCSKPNVTSFRDYHPLVTVDITRSQSLSRASSRIFFSTSTEFSNVVEILRTDFTLPQESFPLTDTRGRHFCSSKCHLCQTQLAVPSPNCILCSLTIRPSHWIYSNISPVLHCALFLPPRHRSCSQNYCRPTCPSQFTRTRHAEGSKERPRRVSGAQKERRVIATETPRPRQQGSAAEAPMPCLNPASRPRRGILNRMSLQRRVSAKAASRERREASSECRGGVQKTCRGSNEIAPKERPGTTEGASTERQASAPENQRKCRDGSVEATKESRMGIDDGLRNAQLVHALDTDGEYAEFHHLQLAARVLQRSMHIHDVETHALTTRSVLGCMSRRAWACSASPGGAAATASSCS